MAKVTWFLSSGVLASGWRGSVTCGPGEDVKNTAELQKRASEEGRAKIASWRRWSLPSILRNRKEGRMAGM